MTNTDLMQSIKDKWGDAIEDACALSSVPQSFVAALIASESGGNQYARRFEPAVYARLKVKYPDWDDDRARDNATSWGLTQIMGINYSGAPVDLVTPAVCLKRTIEMLSEFAGRFQLDLSSEFDDLFHCWNGGNPSAKTFDPDYSNKGQARMEIWASLA